MEVEAYEIQIENQDFLHPMDDLKSFDGESNVVEVRDRYEERDERVEMESEAKVFDD